MSALDASQDREGHEIDSGGRSESDDEGDQDSVAIGNLAAAARAKLADQLLASGRADAAAEAAFRGVPRHTFLPEMARAVINTLIRSASPDGATDGQTSTAVVGSARPGSVGMRRRLRVRLWALLHAQALLSGQTTDVVGIEDDWRRMAGRRAR